MSYPIDLSGRVALVTGASSGLGAQFSRTLAKAGAAGVLAGRRVDRLKSLRAEIEAEGGDAHVVKLDVTDLTSIKAAVAHAETEMGTLDILVNNSGVSTSQRIVDVSAEQGALDISTRDRVRGSLDLSELTVADVMIHRKNIKALDIDLPPREILAQAMSSPHTRMPLYKDEPDNIVGILHARDLLRAISEHGRDGFDIQDVKRPPWFAPMTTSAEDQLAEFLRRREHFALVVDEYGALMGLVTLEDILEEIVGDIKDEHDIAVQGVRQQPDGSVNVDGSVPIRDLNRAMNWDLPDEEAVTIAGLVIHEAQAIPEPGQRFAFHGYRFQVLRRQRNQLTALRVEREMEEGMEGG